MRINITKKKRRLARGGNAPALFVWTMRLQAPAFDEWDRAQLSLDACGARRAWKLFVDECDVPPSTTASSLSTSAPPPTGRAAGRPPPLPPPPLDDWRLASQPAAPAGAPLLPAAAGAAAPQAQLYRQAPAVVGARAERARQRSPSGPQRPRAARCARHGARAPQVAVRRRQQAATAVKPCPRLE